VLNKHPCPISSAPQSSLTAVNEVEAIIFNMETNEVSTKNVLQKFIVPGEKSHYIPRRKWYVQEESNFYFYFLGITYITDEIRYAHHLIAMNPNQRNGIWLPLQGCFHCVYGLDCELLVDSQVRLEKYEYKFEDGNVKG
jgi:hypothetical protein